MKWVSRLAILLLSPVLGGMLGYAFAFLALNGWFEPWRPVDQPPEQAVSLRHINGPEVWVETRSGALYHNEAAAACQRDCWASVAALPGELARNPDVERVTPETCVTPPPLLGAVERVAECQRTMWVDFNTVYARRNGGALFVWQFDSGGEWGALAYLAAIIIGAAALFVVVSLLLLLEAILRWFARRAVSPAGPN